MSHPLFRLRPPDHSFNKQEMVYRNQLAIEYGNDATAKSEPLDALVQVSKSTPHTQKNRNFHNSIAFQPQRQQHLSLNTFDDWPCYTHFFNDGLTVLVIE